MGLLVLAAPPVLAQNAAVRVDINVGTGRKSINPYIYGVAFATQAQLQELNSPVNRNGGNAATRYNWKLNAANRASDYYFESLPYSSAEPGGQIDAFIQATRATGAEPLITIPTIGWVAQLGAGRTRMCSYSVTKYGVQEENDQAHFADAGNGVFPSGEYVDNNPTDANIPVDTLFQQDWVRHLRQKWGSAGNGGVRFYMMDNEPGLWHETHRDVHPEGATMKEVRDKHLAHAASVKQVDPGALILGPEEWGWSGYLYSGYDHQYVDAHGYSLYPDREANGKWDYVPWLLDQYRLHEKATGQRLLDVLTLHYYPQGGEFSTNISSAMQLRRNRSTRSLWDPSYIDETWIKDEVMLIPRMKAWVKTYYPGTLTGITEYSWGAETHISGALAQADVLGIFGREGLDFATRWEVPATNTPTFNAMKLYRNYDGLKSTFGNMSVSCAVPNPDNLSAFAAQRTSDGSLTVMVISKALSGTTPVTLNLAGYAAKGAAQRWQLTNTNTITRLADTAVSTNVLSATVPAQSITLFVIPGQSTYGNVPPEAVVSAAPTSGLAPLTVSFDATESSDEEGPLAAYTWNFGNGQQGSGSQVSHTYTNPGSYTAQLTVKDSGGATHSASVALTVISPTAPLAAPTGLYAQQTGTDATVRWVDNSPDEEGFIIERSAMSPVSFQEVARVGANITRFVDPNVPASTYYYRVRAYAGPRLSDYSNRDAN
ncbi:MAG: glycoside hydrolase family 44 protein [Cystobacter sp.]